MDETIVEVAIVAIAEDGAAVGRVASGTDFGLVCFVPFAAPGESVRARVVERQRKFIRAEVVEVLLPSPERVKPRCPHFGSCGGCDLQHLSYEAQLAAKTKLVRDALRKLIVPEIRVVPAVAEYGYRTRVRVRVENGAVGFSARRSNDFVPVRACPILAPDLEARVLSLTAPASAHASAPAPASVTLSLGGDAETFEQANAEMNRLLVADVAGAVGKDGSPILELYAGSGNFTVPLAMDGHEGEAIERDNAAAIRLISRLGIDSPFRVHASDVADVIDELPATFRTVLLDPPRTGARAALPDILRLAPSRIVYVSCDAATLARDLSALASRYRVDSLALYDFMPQTAHVEVLAVLSKLC